MERTLFENYVVYPEEGKVYSKYVGRYIKSFVSKEGYLQVSLTNGAVQKTYLLHRVLAWGSGILKDLNDTSIEVDHIDTNPLNNAPSNLQALTISEHKDKTAKDRGFQRNKEGCIVCGGPVDSIRVSRCLACHYAHISPKQSLEDIETLVHKFGWSGGGRECGISDNGLRKRYKKLGGDPKLLKKLKS